MRIADLRNIKYFLQMTFLAKKTILSIVCEKKVISAAGQFTTAHEISTNFLLFQQSLKILV